MSVQLSSTAQVSFKGKSDEKKKAKKTSVQNPTTKSKDLEKIPKAVDKAGDVFNDTLEAANDDLTKATENVGKAGITIAGLTAALKKPFVNLNNWMKEPLRDEAGKIIKEVGENGKEIIKKSDKYCKNKVIGVAVAAGAAVIAITTSIIAKHVKNKNAQQDEVKETGEKLDVTSSESDE